MGHQKGTDFCWGWVGFSQKLGCAIGIKKGDENNVRVCE